MIQIEFQSGEIPIAEEESSMLLGLSAAAVESIYFILPVRLRVNGIELFEGGAGEPDVFICQVEREVFGDDARPEMTGPHIPVPVLFLAVEGLRQAQRACHGETAALNFPTGGSLEFHPAGAGVEISSSISGRRTFISCSELLEAFEGFAERVRQYLIEAAPELMQHPAWTTWFHQAGAAG